MLVVEDFNFEYKDFRGLLLNRATVYPSFKYRPTKANWITAKIFLSSSILPYM